MVDGIMSNVWLIILLWFIIAAIIWLIVAMTATALGAFSGVLLLVAAVSLFTAGFHIDSLGYSTAAIGAWIASGFTALGAFMVIGLFIKDFRKQKRRQEIQDLEKEKKP